MADLLSRKIYYNGPAIFTLNDILQQDDLFSHRCALIYTPTNNLPKDVVGVGNIDITLPIVTPDYLEVREIKCYASPRLWMDLIQRTSGFIRWTPIEKARVIITRRDFRRLRDDHYVIGAKALRDALKYKTTGRTDGLSLYYWGAIWDDDMKNADFTYIQETVTELTNVGMRIQIFSHD